MPKISIIVPVYNLEKYVGDTIKSILDQTFTDWELILINDASTDDSLKVIRVYEAKDSRVHVISCQNNEGPMSAREKGCKIAQGDYVTFCDGDDVLVPNALEILYNAAIKDNADIVVGQFLKGYPDGKTEPFEINATLNYGNNRVAFLKSILSREVHQGVAGKMFHKNIIKNSNIKIFEHCIRSEDAAVLFQYANHCKCACTIPDYIYIYNQRSDSTTHSRLTESEIEDICKTSLLRLQISNAYPELDRFINRYLVQNFIGLSVYDFDGTLSKLLKKYDLYKLVSNMNILKYFSIGEFLKLVFYRDLYPKAYMIRKSLKAFGV